MFKELTQLKLLLEEVENICGFNRVLNPDGETWQDRAYYKAVEARKITEIILGQALDKVL